jgi:response regulator RpfG family c-di-GMP phosphodiesterase
MSEAAESSAGWRVLIVDDEPEVHDLTRLVLGDFRFENQALEFISAHSAREARAILRESSDIAIIFLDVVMESEHAGLDLVRFIREDLKNHFVRIVLRTGQPGEAPEERVIEEYDINDYKEKTELTARTLSTTVYSALRAYRDIGILEASRKGLERVIEASAHIFSHEKPGEFASAVLSQLAALTGIERGAFYCRINNPNDADNSELKISAGTGEFKQFVNQPASNEVLPPDIVDSLTVALGKKAHQFGEQHYVLHFTDTQATESLLYVGESCGLSKLDYKLVEVFCTNVSIAYENLHLNQELFDSQLEMICLLAGAAETRSRETANHVKRVGLLAEFIAREYGLPAIQCEDLRFAAPLHDIGKIAIPDIVLNKPGKHTDEEFTIMQTHAEEGYRMLATSNRRLLKLAGEIAWTHHENWDGSGYPRGISGAEIPISGRITMLADVCDALGSRRCYKEPWCAEDVQSYLREQRGKKFDPDLVDHLLANWNKVETARLLLPD